LVQARATFNPLESFPTLQGFGYHPAFASVDPDGVYRAYLADGAVVDAARLTPEQIQTWIDARAPLLDTTAAEKERATYASANSQNVPDEQLLNPPDSVKPLAQLAKLAVTPNPMKAFKRQVLPSGPCPIMSYCVDNFLVCPAEQNCFCNSVICVSGF
jgi:hypothetical protein